MLNEKDVLMICHGLTLLRSDIPTISGKKYSIDILENLKNQINFLEAENASFIVSKVGDHSLYVNEIVGITKDTQIIDKNNLVTDFYVLNTPSGQALMNRPAEERIYLEVVGVGDLDKENNVENYSFIGIQVSDHDSYFK